MWSMGEQELIGIYECRLDGTMVNWYLHLSLTTSKPLISVRPMICRSWHTWFSSCKCMWARTGWSWRRSSQGGWRSCWPSCNFKPAKWATGPVMTHVSCPKARLLWISQWKHDCSISPSAFQEGFSYSQSWPRTTQGREIWETKLAA